MFQINASIKVLLVVHRSSNIYKSFDLLDFQAMMPHYNAVVTC